MKNSCAATGSLKSSRKGSFCSAGEQSLRAFGVEKKMKRIYLTIIAVLSALSAFLALYALGIFDFGRFSAVDEPSQFASERSERVNASSVWRIAVLGSYTDELYVAEAAPGIGRMALMINMKGGILGKPVKVSFVEPQEDSYETRLAAQKISQDPEVAYLLGPMSTAHVREVRTLSQYHALPALAPLSPSVPDLPVLEPDTFTSIYPASLLFDPLIEKLKDMGCRNVLFISSEAPSYSSAFAGMLTAHLRRDPFFNEIHRIDFASPAQEGHFYEPLKRLHENSTIDAVIYTDAPENLQILGRVMGELNIKLPVFGTDLLATATLAHYVRGFEFPLYYAAFEGNVLPEDVADDYARIFKKTPSIKEQLGMLGVIFFRDALHELKLYEPAAVGEKIKSMAQTYFLDKSRRVNMVIHQVGTSGEGHE